MLDYKDLAALPKTKAIYNIDRPDMLSYSPYVSYPSEERHYGEVDQPHNSSYTVVEINQKHLLKSCA